MSNLKIYAVITKIVGNGKMTGYKLQYEIYAKTGKLYSESTITRRLREMGAKATPPPKGKKINGKRVTAWTYSLYGKKGGVK
jgi:hypothetical protein